MNASQMVQANWAQDNLSIIFFNMGNDQHKNPNMNNNKDLLGGQLTTDYRARGPTYLEPFDDTYISDFNLTLSIIPRFPKNSD